MEYLLGIDGAYVPDPSNRQRARGPFGDKSVIEWPEYEPPAWLDSIADAGPVEHLELRCRRLVARVRVISTRPRSRRAPTRRCSSCTTGRSTPSTRASRASST